MVMTHRQRAAGAEETKSGTDASSDEQTGVRVTASKATVTTSLELKLGRARVIIAHMPPADPHARLLQVAVLRRDEILLEALLRRLDPFPSP
jgi:hypothetical protein